MTVPHLLVVAKAPVPGRVKTRLGADIGMTAAATLAAASLADTLDVCAATFGPQRCCLALDGSLTDAVDGAELAGIVEGWTVFPQRGDGLASRLVSAHVEAAERTGAALVQLGMDTPQITPELLVAAADQLAAADAVLGPADDGGWWVLGMREPERVTAIAGVPMSTSRTGEDTRLALLGAGLSVATTRTLRDVDTVEDAGLVAQAIPGSRFDLAWQAVVAGRGSDDGS